VDMYQWSTALNNLLTGTTTNKVDIKVFYSPTNAQVIVLKTVLKFTLI